MTYEKPVFLLDVCCTIPRRTKFSPSGLVQDLNDLPELKEASDSIIRDYLDKENLILITSDYRFALKTILAGKKAIFVEDTFNESRFHIIYPSILTKQSIFWQDDYINELQSPDVDMSYLFMKSTHKGRKGCARLNLCLDTHSEI